MDRSHARVSTIGHILFDYLSFSLHNVRYFSPDTYILQAVRSSYFSWRESSISVWYDRRARHSDRRYGYKNVIFIKEALSDRWIIDLSIKNSLIFRMFWKLHIFSTFSVKIIII